MAKYYVISKDIKAIVIANSPKEAAIECMLKYLQEGVNVSSIIVVNEIGFDINFHNDSDDEIFDTEDILISAGFLNDNENYF